MLTSDQKGAVAETAVAHAAARVGIGVLKPIAPVRYDLAFDLGNRFVRVQCKWASRRADVVTVYCYSSRRDAAGLRRKTYSVDDTDLIIGYCAELERCYVVSPARFDGRYQLDLRLSPPRNGQSARINWARDYEFERLDWANPGAIAQLGERRAGSAKVAGSSPAGSTKDS